MKLFINDIQVISSGVTGTGIDDIDFTRTLKKSIDRANIDIVNLPSSFLPLSYKTVDIKDNSDNVLFTGVITNYKKRNQKGSTNYTKYTIYADSIETILNTKYYGEVFTGYLYEIIPDMFTVLNLTGFTFDIDTELKVKNIPIEETVLNIIDTLTNSCGAVYWITAGKKIYIKKTFEESGLTLDTTDLSNIRDYKDFTITPDSTQLITVVKVRHCKVLGTIRIEEPEMTGGQTQQIWKIFHKFKDLRVFVKLSGETEWTEKAVGTEFIHSDEDYDFLYNFNEQYIRASSELAELTIDDKIKVDGYPYQDYFYDYEPEALINEIATLTGTDGRFEYMTTAQEINAINSAQDAIEYAKKLVNEKGNIQLSGNIKIESSTALTELIGKTILINSPDDNINNHKFLITKVKADYSKTRWNYTIYIDSFLFGLEDAIEKLFKKSGQSKDADYIPKSLSYNDNIEVTGELTVNSYNLSTNKLIFGGTNVGFGNSGLY